MTTPEKYTSDILGDDYVAHTFELGPDPDNEAGSDIVATLVKHVAGPESPHHAVLWVHGFSDYFFQTGIAEFFAERGYAFYALDLRKSGRSLRSGQTAHYATDFTAYDTELDLAVKVIGQEHPGLGLVVAAHSTGGLITSLWLDRRRIQGRTAPIEGQVLDSPWFDLQGSKLTRSVLTLALRVLGNALGTTELPVTQGPVYGQSLHVSERGEFDYDVRLKPIDGFPVRFGWLRAVRVAHSQLHRGVEVGVPTLVLHSSKSLTPKEYSAQAARADVVVDVEQVAQWACAVGATVSVVPIRNARHDVFLSEPAARVEAYDALQRWLVREIEE